MSEVKVSRLRSADVMYAVDVTPKGWNDNLTEVCNQVAAILTRFTTTQELRITPKAIVAYVLVSEDVSIERLDEIAAELRR